MSVLSSVDRTSLPLSCRNSGNGGVRTLFRCRFRTRRAALPSAPDRNRRSFAAAPVLRAFREFGRVHPRCRNTDSDISFLVLTNTLNTHIEQHGPCDRKLPGSSHRGGFSPARRFRIFDASAPSGTWAPLDAPAPFSTFAPRRLTLSSSPGGPGTHDADTKRHKSAGCVLLKYHVKRDYSSQKSKKKRFFDVFRTKKGV